MKNKILSLAMCFALVFFVSQNTQAQAWKNKLKNAASKQLNKKKNTNSKSNSNTAVNNANRTGNATNKNTLNNRTQTNTNTTQTNTNTNVKTTNGFPAPVEAETMYNFYKKRTYIANNWPYSVNPTYFPNEKIDGIETLDMANFEKQMEADKTKYPKLFKYHGMEQSMPAGMEFGSAGSGRPERGHLEQINSLIIKYYQWKTKLVKQQNDISQVVQHKIVEAEQAQDKDKIEKAMLAVRAAKAMKSIAPDNFMLDDLIKSAYTTLDKSYDDVKHILTGDMHKVHFKEIVGYTQKPKIGSENTASISKEIQVGKPFYMVGYFPEQIKNLNLKGKYKGLPTSKAPILEWELASDKNVKGRQQLYWNVNMMKTTKEQSYYMFNLFPDLANTDFASHLEYIPTLNLIKWLTFQMPGEYEFKFYFSNGTNIGKFAIGNFKIKLTRESILELREYYKKLTEKKIASVTFNDANSCKNIKGTIGRAEQLQKYGELVKITCGQTGQMMKPWPQDHVINNYIGTGYAVFKKPDGRYEIISVQFTRPPNVIEWDFASISVSNDYELTGSINIRPEIIKQGYEIKKENIDKCKSW